MDWFKSNILNVIAYILIGICILGILYLQSSNLLYFIIALLFLYSFFNYSHRRDEEIKQKSSDLIYLDRKYTFQLMGWSIVLIVAGFITYISIFSEDLYQNIGMLIISSVLTLASIVIIVGAIIALIKLKRLKK